MQSGVILLVGSDKNYRELLTALLRSEGFVVPQAVDAGDALSQLDGGLFPDLILTSLTMPFMEGLCFCRKLREDPRYKNIPLVVVSAVALKVIQESLPAGLMTLLELVRDL
jgi:CheY-like chemotaxis protein